MELIDVDRIKVVENYIHYIKTYNASAVLMDKKSKIFRFDIRFSIEHKPVGIPEVKIKFIEHPHFPILGLIKKIKMKIYEMDKRGILSGVKP